MGKFGANNQPKVIQLSEFLKYLFDSVLAHFSKKIRIFQKIITKNFQKDYHGVKEYAVSINGGFRTFSLSGIQ